MLKTKSLTTVVLLIFGIFLTACSRSYSKAKPGSAPVTTTKADTSKPKLPDAPNFTLKTMDGDMFTLSEHRGQVIVLNFWATWCPPCRKEIPNFIKIQKELRDEGVLFVGVSLDREGWKAVRPFAKKYGINYPIMVDDGTVSRKYGPFRGIPTTFIINEKGKVVFGATGMINTKALKPALKELANN